MIRNGNICFMPTRLAAPEICDREFISGLSISPVALTLTGERGGLIRLYFRSLWLHLFLCINLQQDNVESTAWRFLFLHHQILMVEGKSCKEKSGVSGFEFDFKSTKAGHASQTSNHSFIMPAEREVMGVFSRHIRELLADSRWGTWRPV